MVTHYTGKRLLPEEMVREFHEKFGHPIGVPPNKDLLWLRFNLIDEEVVELYEELIDYETTGKLDVNLIKELADIQYVISGMAIALGIDLNEATWRVHQSNMSKLQEDGTVKYREDGKVLKGVNYQEPDLADLVSWN